MLYDVETQTLVETVMTVPDRAKLEELAGYRGKNIEQGRIARVAVVCLDPTIAANVKADAEALGLELRAIVEGAEKVLVEGTTADDGAEELLYPILRTGNADTKLMLRRRLLDNAPELDLWVTFAVDKGDHVVRLGEDVGRDIAKVEQEALQNVARRPFTIRELKSNVLLIEDEYGAEGLLCKELMQRIHQQLDADPIICAVPRQGVIIATPMDPQGGLQVLTMLSAKLYSDAETSQVRRLSQVPLIVSDGRLVGLVQVNPEGESEHALDDEPVKLKPWWKFW